MKNFRSALLAAALSLVVAAGSATAAQAATKIRVGASPTPHAEILKVANEVLKPQGYEIQIERVIDPGSDKVKDVPRVIDDRTGQQGIEYVEAQDMY